MRYRTSVLLATVLLTGCAALQPPAQAPTPPYVPGSLVNAPPTPVNVPPDPLAMLPPEIRGQVLSGQPRPIHKGIATIFPFDPYNQPVINCQVLRVTEVVFAPDEKVTADGIGIGDSVRWAVQPTGNRLLVKPKEAGIATDLIVATSGRSYHLALRTRSPYMPQVSFYYPDEIQAAEAARASALRKAAQQVADPIPSKPLNFAYDISGPNYAFKPLQVFDDGSHSYVQLPDSASGTDMPVLFVQDGKQQSLLNYEVKGSYLIADRLFQHAVLSSGTGADREIIRITAEAH
jgi:P-type conjugative transfer protein TrbG